MPLKLTAPTRVSRGHFLGHVWDYFRNWWPHKAHQDGLFFFWYISLESQLIRENPHDDPIFEARAGPRIVS